MQMLNNVSCRGANNTASGRTKIRIAPDVIRQERGMRLARKLRKMWNNGCDIRIGYTVVGIDVGRFLRQSSGRGPVPMKHLTQDFNGDGEFDNYFHLKSMTIGATYDGDPHRLRPAQRLGQLVGHRQGQRREPRHLPKPQAGAALRGAPRLLVQELPTQRAVHLDVGSAGWSPTTS